MLLAEGIRNSSTIDKREMNIFFNERRFWRNVLERLIDIALFLSERNLAFRGSEEVLGSPHNGNFLGIFELLARKDPILKELQDRIKNKNTKDHYLSPTIQNELPYLPVYKSTFFDQIYTLKIRPRLIHRV